MVAKRALNFGTPSRKRARIQPTMVLYRSPRPEMKFFETTFAYAGIATLNLDLNEMAQGSNVNERVGNKIKVWSIEFILAQAAGDPIRVDLLMPNLVTDNPSHTFSQAVDRKKFNVLLTKFLHSGANENSRGCIVRHKLPYGVVTKFFDSGANSCNSNLIMAHITTPSATTVTGYFRIWYTDV